MSDHVTGSPTKTPQRSLWVAVAGVVVMAVSAVLLAIQLPDALAKNDRAHAAAVLQAQISAVRAQVSSTEMATSSARADLAAQQGSNVDLAAKIAGQKKKIAKLQKQVDSLGKEIAKLKP